MRFRTVLLAVAGTTAVAVVVAGCGSSHSGAPSAGKQGAVSDRVAAVPSAASLPAPAGHYAEASGAAAGGTATGGGSSDQTTLLSDNRSVIRRAELTVGVKTASAVAVQANKAEAIVGDLGGDVFGDDRSSGTDATATLTLKVPPSSLIKALDELSALGKEQSRDLSSQDVTTQVADVNARVLSAEASIARLRTLYSSATKVSDVIEIEQELASRQSDLESLQGQQKALSEETQYATISLVLTTMKAPTPPVKHHHRGIGGAFARGWDHFVSAGAWMVSAIAAVGPWVLIVLLVGAGLISIRRRRATEAA